MSSPYDDAPIEMTTKYATSVPDLPSAWAFVMAHVDKVGDQPRIVISPVASWSVHDMDDPNATPDRGFEVTVSGMVEQ